MLMSKFLTLVRRDMADNRGALIITPLVIAAILFLVTLMASLSGNARFGIDPREFSSAAQQSMDSGRAEIDIDGQKSKVSRDAQGRIIITTPEGQTKTIDGMISAEQKEKVSTLLPVGTAIASSLPLGIAAIAILFVLAGGLHDERKDRTILFWKSMPVTDLQTVGAKMVSIIGGGFGSAFAIVIALNLAITIIAVLTLGRVGITGVDLGGVLANSSKLWLLMLGVLLVYIGWALPVYGWMTMVSAWAPKMPFVAAFAPMIVVPLVYLAVAFRGNDNDPILSALWDPLSRLVGEPVIVRIQEALNKIPDTSSALPVNDLLAHLGQSIAHPAFWLGILAAGGFVYAASEIRRRRAL
jgi:ABC-2 type transport system permease protein